MMFLRARSLAMGYSGARPVLAETMLAMLAAGITPVVPEHGSLGASGDLAPLAHCALALIGEGEVVDANGEHGSRPPTRWRRPGSSRRCSGPKEGLALINGTDGILGMLVLALADLDELLALADVAAAMTTEARARHRPRLRRRPRRAAPAARAGRERGQPHPPARRLGDRRQPPRGRPAGAGRLLDSLHARRSTAPRATPAPTSTRSRRTSSRAAIDNPMVLPDGRVESCGNFHGAPVAMACDFLAIAAADVGAISERRTDRLLDATRSQGLPPFLAAGCRRQLGADDRPVHAGGDGRREPAASRTPAAVDSLPTSAMQEDHVSMGWGAARKLRRSVANLRRILAVELAAAARAIELRAPLEPAAGTGAAVDAVRSAGVVPGAGPTAGSRPSSRASRACSPAACC